jgi:alkylation response protein AidB-like acyl-CoA dehydrogenase
MAQLISDRRDMDFVLFEQLNVQDLSKHPQFEEFNKKTVELIISEARNLAIKEILPTRKISDDEGVRFDNGQVSVPECFHRAFKIYNEGEWLAMQEDPEWGGQGMPSAVALAASEFFNGANYAFMMYPGLTHGAARLVEAFGTDTQKNLFLKNMYTGKWTGTMLLTEPEAGSDVGLLETKAVKNEDGTYTITGNKIFISSGEHDLSENIIHPVLARIEGAPAGTKGISLFLVPKFNVNEDGTIGEFNDVVCTGIEEKMGIHGNATCSLTLGGKGNCTGTLLGEENRGMPAMFLMMNEARLLVGHQGLGCASAAYMYAVNYARERIQGRSITAGRDASAVAIINHPDVRRQLLTMKAYVDGMRSLLYFMGFCQDNIKTTTDEDEKARYQGFIELLTPIAKGYVTDRAFEVCNHGVQVYGGYGYIKDYPMEQLVRDCRITMLYEGTNGIQAMDLLGRKLAMNDGQIFMEFLNEINRTVEAAKSIDNLKKMAENVEQAVAKLQKTAMHLAGIAMSEAAANAFAWAYPFMEVVGDLTMAWMLLWRAVVAAENLEKGAKKKDVEFYQGQLKTAGFFVSYFLPATLGKMNAILEADDAAVVISDAGFGG